MWIERSPQTHSPQKSGDETTKAIQDAESNCFKLGSSETFQLVRPTVQFLVGCDPKYTYLINFDKHWEYDKITNKQK